MINRYNEGVKRSAPLDEKPADDAEESLTKDSAGEDVIALDDLDAILDSDDSDDIAIPEAQGGASEDVEVDPILGEPKFSELSNKDKARYVLRKIIQSPRLISDEILYFIGGIEHGIKRGFINGIQWIKSSILGLVGKAKSGVTNIPKPNLPDFSWVKTYDWKGQAKKLAIGGAVTAAVGGLLYTWLSFQNLVGNEPFIKSLAEESSETFYFDESRLESFYSSPRFAAFTLELPQLVVNLLSEREGASPIAAFKFSIELSSQSTTDEIEENKAAVIDKMQRVMNGWRYRELVTPQGKRKMTEQIVSEVNLLLKTGRIKHLYIDTAILKP